MALEMASRGGRERQPLLRRAPRAVLPREGGSSGGRKDILMLLSDDLSWLILVLIL